ncbi:MAG: diguanylate cyclase [Sneathiellaceae bacterium]
MSIAIGSERSASRTLNEAAAVDVVRVGLLDDDGEEAELYQDYLDEVSPGRYRVRLYAGSDEGDDALRGNSADIFLVDYRLGPRSGLDVVDEARLAGLDRPIVVLTGQGSRAVDLESMRLGAADFLDKNTLSPALLERSLRYSLKQWRVVRQLERANVELETARQQVELLANTDYLTGLANRRHFIELCERMRQRARFSGTTNCFLLLDIDHFKRINDTFGHSAGDFALQSFGQIMRRVLRPNDIMGRIGGEEFGALLPGCDLDGGRTVGERLREATESQSIRHLDADLVLRISGGVALVDNEPGGIDRAMSQADAALYGAKQAGRNRVFVAG